MEFLDDEAGNIGSTGFNQVARALADKFPDPAGHRIVIDRPLDVVVHLGERGRRFDAEIHLEFLLLLALLIRDSHRRSGSQPFDPDFVHNIQRRSDIPRMSTSCAMHGEYPSDQTPSRPPRQLRHARPNHSDLKP